MEMNIKSTSKFFTTWQLMPFRISEFSIWFYQGYIERIVDVEIIAQFLNMVKILR